MSPEAIEGIVRTSGARHLVLGTGRDAPDPREAGLDRFPTTAVDALDRRARRRSFPPDWEAQLARLAAAAPSDLFELVFTSGTTGTPKGVMLAHDNVIASIETFHRIVPPMEHRLVSLLPLSHLLEQAVGLFYALSVGADILYVRSRNPRVIFDALRDQRVTSMVVVPRSSTCSGARSSARSPSAAARPRSTAFAAIARHLPMASGARLFGSVHAQLGGHFRLFLSAGAFLPPALQQGWEDLGVTVLQGYGATETGTGGCTTLDDHGLGTVGRPPEGVEMRIADDGEIQFRGPTVFRGYWENPTATAEAFTADGWYRTGDIGHLDDARPADPVRPQARTSSSCPTASTSIPRTSRTRCASPASAIRSSSRRSPAGSRRSSSARRRGAPGAAEATGPVGASEPGSMPRSRPPTRRSARTSGSPAGGCGPRRTSRGPTRSRSSAARSGPGSPPTRRCRSPAADASARDRVARPRASRAPAWIPGADRVGRAPGSQS